MKIKKIPTEKKWYKCPICGCKIAVYDDTAECSNVFIKCRTCKNEIEIKI